MIGRDLEFHGDESIDDEDGLWPVFSGKGPLPAAGVPVLLAAGAFPGCPATGLQARSVRDRWRLAAARVVDRNAQILVLRLAARALHREDVVQTELLAPARMSLPKIESWVREADQELAQDRRRLRMALVREALRLLTDRLPPMDPWVVAMARRLTLDGEPGPDVRIRRRLTMLDPENTAGRWAQALELAARAAVTRSPVAACAYADQLVSVVRANNAETKRRREESMIAAGYLQALEAVPGADPRRDRLIGRLGSVLAGELTLRDDVQDAAERLRCQIEENAERAYLCGLLRGHLARHGFTVLVEAGEPDGVALKVRGGQLLVHAGLVTAAAPRSGTRPSPAFTRAVDELAPLLGATPTWAPAAFDSARTQPSMTVVSSATRRSASST
jgi:hypothetical protein